MKKSNPLRSTGPVPHLRRESIKSIVLLRRTASGADTGSDGGYAKQNGSANFVVIEDTVASGFSSPVNKKGHSSPVTNGAVSGAIATPEAAVSTTGPGNFFYLSVLLPSRFDVVILIIFSELFGLHPRDRYAAFSGRLPLPVSVSARTIGYVNASRS